MRGRGLSLMAFALALVPVRTLAHEGGDVVGGFLSGLKHPVLGPDHVVAMVAVGLWGVQLGRPANWMLPVAFPLVMALGGAFGARGLPLPGVEFGIALSAMVLGVMVALAARPPLGVAAAMVALFAVFHGHAHGTELPGAASPLAYGAGFVTSTGLLHLSGIALGLMTKWPMGVRIVRACGVLVGAIGGYFLWAAFSGA